MTTTAPLLFDIKDLSAEADSMKRLTDLFSKLGESLVSHDVSPVLKRTSGVSYKEVNLTFADSQTVTLAIKQTGDIWKVKINNKETPLRHQDAHKPDDVVQELVQKIKAGRSAYQKKIAAAVNAGDVAQAAKTVGLKNTQANRITALEAHDTALDQAIDEANKRKAELVAEVGE